MREETSKSYGGESIKSVGVIGSRSLPFTLFLPSWRHRPGLTRQALPYCHRRSRWR